MVTWSYKCYDSGARPNLWQKWYDDNPQARGAHDAVFDLLEQLDSWEGSNFKRLRGQQSGLQEVKFFGLDRRQWRVFGKIGEQNHQYLVLGVGFHKDKQYKPRNILGKIVQRYDEISEKSAKAIKCKRPSA